MNSDDNNRLQLSASDFIKSRDNPHAQRMRWPTDADTTQRLTAIIDGGSRAPFLRRLWRRFTRLFSG